MRQQRVGLSLALLGSLATSLVACGGSDGKADFWNSLVVDRYGDCLQALGVEGEPEFRANKSESREGVVSFTGIDGQVLAFAVGTAPGGASLTVPGNAKTVAALESVGC